MNLYAYVGGNPINFTDPMGLAVLAECRFKSFTTIAGGGTLKCKLSNLDCRNGFRQVADYKAILKGGSFGLPHGDVKFTVTFDFAYDVHSLEGHASLCSAGVAAGGGFAMSEICLNGHCKKGLGWQTGKDLSIGSFTGPGKITNEGVECCGKYADSCYDS